MKRRTVLLPMIAAVAVLLVLALVWILVLDKAETAPRLSDGCGIAPPAVPGETAVFSMVVDGLEREYRLHLPVDYDQDTPASLVLAFHWYEGDAESMEYFTRMSPHADEHGYAVVYPQSTSFESARGTITSWNDLTCSVSTGPEGPTCSRDITWPFPPECGEPRDCAWCTCNDDLAYVERLLDELEDSVCIDLDRVYATGVSNGAMFVHRLGCDMADRFAAIAPVAGTLAKGFSCAPSARTPISIMHLHGDRDRLIPSDGSEGTNGHLLVPVQDVMDAWAGVESQECDNLETLYPTSRDGTQELACAQRANCATGAEVVSCTWKGNHDSSMTVNFAFGNDVMWDFFSKNSKQR